MSYVLGDFYAKTGSAIDPRKYPDELFDLLSVPSHDRGIPDLAMGAEIGSFKIPVEPGDVLICKIVPHIRRVWVVPSKGDSRQIASGEWIVLRGDQFDPNYLRHLLLDDRFHSKFMATIAGVGGSLLRARPAHAASIPVALPPLPEQRRIASILDRVDASRRIRHRTISELGIAINALMQEALESRTSHEVRELASLVRPDTTVTYGIVQAGPEILSGVPYIRTSDLVSGHINEANLRHTSAEIAAKFPRSRVETGDIVMSIRATVGTTAVVPPSLDGANLTQGTARIAPGPEVIADFLLEYLRSAQAQRWLAAQVKGATFMEITLGRLREMPVPVAPMAIQVGFASKSQKLQELANILREHLARLDELFASLQHRAFSGEL